MQLTHVNLGQARWHTTHKKTEQTGIYKEPATGPVEITPLGVAGDTVCDTKNHGGPDQAVYIYGGGDYAWWEAELGQALLPGTYGENLTISELESAAFAAGDRLQLGAVTLEVSAPRIPCATLAARMGDTGFVKRFRQAGRPGLYCRVITPGYVQAGDLLQVTPYDSDRLTIFEMFQDYYEAQLPEATIRRHLAAPIAIRARAEMEDQLARLLAARSPQM
jgi:MOSC domain-containing protein YiiM